MLGMDAGCDVKVFAPSSLVSTTRGCLNSDEVGWCSAGTNLS